MSSSVKLIRSGRRTLMLEVGEDLEVKVRAPWSVSEKTIARFIESRRDWIEKAKESVLSKVSRIRPLREGQLFWRGCFYPLRAESGLEQRFAFKETHFAIHPLWLNEAKETALAWFKKQAVLILQQRLDVLAKELQVNYTRFRLGQARTRWGSCSPRGVVTLHWRLVSTPDWVRDYVIIHELCHRQHFDHSHSFWRAVQKHCPRYLEACRWLNDHGALLTSQSASPQASAS